MNLAEVIKPTGYQVLIQMRTPRTETAGGIALAQESIRNEIMLEQVGQVVAMGPQAYAHEKFGGVPFCQIGDWVLVGQYAGVPVPLPQGHAILVNDDEIRAVLTQPEHIRKSAL